MADAGVMEDLNSFSCLFYGLVRLFKDRSRAQIRSFHCIFSLLEVSLEGRKEMQGRKHLVPA